MKKIGLLLISFFFLTTLYGTAKEEITLGYAANVSGAGSELWVHGRNGLELAIDAFNEENKSFSVSLEIANLTGDKEQDTLILQELIDKDIHIIFGPVTSKYANDLWDFFSDDNQLYLVSTASSEDFNGFDDSLVRNSSPAYAGAVDMAYAVLDHESFSSYVTISGDGNRNYNEAIIRGVDEVLQDKLNLDSSGDFLFPSGVSDEEAFEVVQEAMASAPEAVLVSGNDRDSAAIIQQIHKINPDLVLMMAGWAISEDFLLYTGKSSEGVYSIGTYDFTNDNPSFQSYLTEYREKYGMDPLFSASRYYELIQLVFWAQNLTGSWSPRDVKSAILNQGDFKLDNFDFLFEDFHIDAYGDCTRKAFIVKVENGQWLGVDFEY